MVGLLLVGDATASAFDHRNLEGLQAFADKHVVGTNLMLHDGLWIFYFLSHKGDLYRKALSKRSFLIEERPANI